MTRMTEDQKVWINANEKQLEVDAATYEKIAALALNEAFNALSELENIKNTCINHAGYNNFALSRDAIHNQREDILHMAKQCGAGAREYPLNLIGGQYRED